MKRRMILAMAMVVGLIFHCVPAMGDILVTFSGSGTSGTDPYGNPWVLNLSSDIRDTYMWGIPGYGKGTIPWNGPVAIADFHVTFNEGWLVDENPVPTNPFGLDSSTRFSDTTKGVLWNRSISGSTVDFVAAGLTDELSINDQFFVNVHFLPLTADNAESTFGFTASYTTIPESATMFLLGSGLLGLWGVRRKFKK